MTSLDATVGTNIQRWVLSCQLISRCLERPMPVVRRYVLLPRRQGLKVGDLLRQRTPESRIGSAWLMPFDRLYRKVVCFNVFNQFRGLHNRWHTITPCPSILPMRMGAASCGAHRCLERFSLGCTVSTDHDQATAEVDWHEPVHWYANRSRHGVQRRGRDSPQQPTSFSKIMTHGVKKAKLIVFIIGRN